MPPGVTLTHGPHAASTWSTFSIRLIPLLLFSQLLAALSCIRTDDGIICWFGSLQLLSKFAVNAKTVDVGTEEDDLTSDTRFQFVMNIRRISDRSLALSDTTPSADITDQHR